MPPPASSSTSARGALLTAARQELSEHGTGAVSLRAIARRAGVSHAAPKYFFDDRAGLLTAVATEGFRELASRLRDARATDGTLANAGRVYFDFGLDESALFDLMFRASELHPDDSDLRDAKADALAQLTAVVGGSDAAEARDLTLGNWAFAHGLVVLAREQALGASTGSTSAESTSTGSTSTESASAESSRSPRDVAYRLFDVFSSAANGIR